MTMTESRVTKTSYEQYPIFKQKLLTQRTSVVWTLWSKNEQSIDTHSKWVKMSDVSKKDIITAITDIFK